MLKAKISSLADTGRLYRNISELTYQTLSPSSFTRNISNVGTTDTPLLLSSGQSSQSAISQPLANTEGKKLELSLLTDNATKATNLLSLFNERIMSPQGGIKKSFIQTNGYIFTILRRPSSGRCNNLTDYDIDNRESFLVDLHKRKERVGLLFSFRKEIMDSDLNTFQTGKMIANTWEDGRCIISHAEECTAYLVYKALDTDEVFKGADFIRLCDMDNADSMTKVYRVRVYNAHYKKYLHEFCVIGKINGERNQSWEDIFSSCALNNISTCQGTGNPFELPIKESPWVIDGLFNISAPIHQYLSLLNKKIKQLNDDDIVFQTTYQIDPEFQLALEMEAMKRLYVKEKQKEWLEKQQLDSKKIRTDKYIYPVEFFECIAGSTLQIYEVDKSSLEDRQLVSPTGKDIFF